MSKRTNAPCPAAKAPEQGDRIKKMLGSDIAEGFAKNLADNLANGLANSLGKKLHLKAASTAVAYDGTLLVTEQERRMIARDPDYDSNRDWQRLYALDQRREAFRNDALRQAQEDAQVQKVSEQIDDARREYYRQANLARQGAENTLEQSAQTVNELNERLTRLVDMKADDILRRIRVDLLD